MYRRPTRRTKTAAKAVTEQAAKKLFEHYLRKLKDPSKSPKTWEDFYDAEKAARAEAKKKKTTLGDKAQKVLKNTWDVANMTLGPKKKKKGTLIENVVARHQASANPVQQVMGVLDTLDEMNAGLTKTLSSIRTKLVTLQAKHVSISQGFMGFMGPTKKVDRALKASAKLGSFLTKARKKVLRASTGRRAYVPGLFEFMAFAFAVSAMVKLLQKALKWILNRPLDLEGNQSLLELVTISQQLEGIPNNLRRALSKTLGKLPSDGSPLSAGVQEILTELMDVLSPRSELARSLQEMTMMLSKEAKALGQRPREDWVLPFTDKRLASIADRVLDVHLEKLADSKTGKPEGDGTGVGLFLPLPPYLAEHFPSLAPDDNSPPHVTLLYVGDVPKEKEEAFLRVLAYVATDIPNVVKAQLHQLDYFQHADKDRVIAYMSVSFSHDLARFKYRILSALEDLGIEAQDNFPANFNPHVTLAYLPGLDTVWKGMIPSGTWEMDSMQVWGLPQLHEISFGT